MERPDAMVCPIVGKMISEDVCYELIMGLYGQIKLSSIPEVKVLNRETAREICDNCPYSDID